MNNWIWMPHPGHFICARQCKYHLNTYVNGYIVSTIGELWPELPVRIIHAQIFDESWFAKNKHLKGDYFDDAYFKHFGYHEIGVDTKYETMVFKAKKDKSKCCPWIVSSWKELECARYYNPDNATEGHYAMCHKWQLDRI